MAALRDAIALLPRGVAWSKSPDSRLGKLLDALTREFDRVEGRAADLLRESNPATTSELLLEWDAIVALNYPALSTTEPDASIARAMIAWLLGTSTLSRESIERFCALSELQVFADGDGVTRPLYRLLGVDHTGTHEATIRLLSDGGANSIVEALFRRKAHATGTLVFDWAAPAIAITSPAAGTVCSTLLDVSGTSTGVGAVRVTVTESGGLVTHYDTEAEADGSWATQVALASFLAGEDTTLVARGYTGIVTADSGWVESADVVVVGEYEDAFDYVGPLTTDLAAPVLTGTATPGASIVLTYGGDDSAPFVADGAGAWSFDMSELNPLVVGTNELSFAITGPSPCAHVDTVVVEVERTASGGVAPTITVAPVLTWTVEHGTSPTITEGTYTGDAGTWTYDLVRGATTVLSGVSKATAEAYVSDRATDVGPNWKVTGTITNGAGSDAADSNEVAWDPVAILSPVRWLEADAADVTVNGSDDVTEWADRSPSNVPMKGPGGPIPTYVATDANLNNQGSIDFTASANETLREDAISADLRCLHDATGGTFVAVVDTDGAGTQQTLYQTSQVFTAANVGLIVRYTATSWRVAVCNGSGTFVADVTGAITPGAKGALVVRLDASQSPPFSVRWRGAQIASAASLAGTPSTSNGTGLARLGLTGTLVQPFDGRVAQIGVVPDYVSGDALLDLERYCEWKWGL